MNTDISVKNYIVTLYKTSINSIIVRIYNVIYL